MTQCKFRIDPEKVCGGIPFYEKANEIEPKGEDFYNVACGYSLTGNADKAFENLNNAMQYGFNSRQNYESYPDLQLLQSDARFQELLQKLK